MTTPRPESGVSPRRSQDRERECTVVVPVYNSQATLPALAERLAAVLPGVADRFEAVLVNDGSRDNSWEAICQAARKHAWIRGINLMRNYGQHNALLAGIRAARYAVTVTMDDDLQHPPEEIPMLFETLGQGHDLVYGTPALPARPRGSMPGSARRHCSIGGGEPRGLHPRGVQAPSARTRRRPAGPAVRGRLPPEARVDRLGQDQRASAVPGSASRRLVRDCGETRRGAVGPPAAADRPQACRLVQSVTRPTESARR